MLISLLFFFEDARLIWLQTCLAGIQHTVKNRVHFCHKIHISWQIFRIHQHHLWFQLFNSDKLCTRKRFRSDFSVVLLQYNYTKPSVNSSWILSHIDQIKLTIFHPIWFLDAWKCVSTPCSVFTELECRTWLELDAPGMLNTTPLHQLGVATLLFFIYLKEKKTSKLCSFCVCSFSCYPREIFLTCFYRGISFFLKLLKTLKIFYSAAKHFSLSFFLGFNFFCGIQYKIFLSQITRSVCHVFKLQAIKSLVYI